MIVFFLKLLIIYLLQTMLRIRSKPLKCFKTHTVYIYDPFLTFLLGETYGFH